MDVIGFRGVGGIFAGRVKIKGVLASWILSYLLILSIPIVMCSAIYIKAEESMESEINKSNAAMMAQCQQALDAGLEDVNKLIYQIALSKSLKLMTSYDKQLEIDDYSIVYQAVDNFNFYREFSGYIDTCFIYIKNVDRVFTRDGLLDKRLYFESKWINAGYYDGMSFEEWDSLIQGNYSGRFVALGGKNAYDNVLGRSVVYSVKLPLGESDDPEATVVVLLNYGRIYNIIKNAQQTDNSSEFILSKDNQVLFSTGHTDEFPEILKYDSFPSDKGLVYTTVNGRKLVVSYTTSKIVKWKYVSVIPYSTFRSKVEHVRSLVYLSILLSLILGAVISCLIARRNYNPLNDVVSLLEKYFKPMQGKKYNEFKYIKDRIADTISENMSIHKKLRQQDSVLRSNFLARLVKGRFTDPDPVAGMLPNYQIEFESDSFAVVLFYITDFSTFFTSMYSQTTTEEKIKLVQFIITNIFEELVNKENHGYMTEVDEMMACLVNFKREDGELDKILQCAKEARDFIRDKFDIDFFVSISGMHQTFAGIPKAYREALDAMEYAISMENGDIYCFNDIKKLNGMYDYSIETETQLINCIRAGDFEKSKKLLNEIFDSNFTKNTLPMDMVKCLMFDLVNTMLKIIPEISFACDDNFIEDLHIVNRLMECGKIHELKCQIADITEKICAYIKQHRRDKHDHFIEEVIRFIDENYHDVNLGVASAAEQFNMSAASLTRLFKEQTGKGMLEYITRVRIEKAKILLQGQDCNIKDVAAQVGYLSSNVFIKAFKKYEGVTPGSYKK